jgi:hypothetical protein
MFIYALVKSSLHPPGHMNKYYIFSITGALFFTYVLIRFSQELKINIAMLMFSAILSIYAIEFILSYNKKISAINHREQLAAEQGIPFDSRYRIQVMMDLRSQGIEVYPLYNPNENMTINNVETFPLGYISNKTIITCNESGKYITFKNDEHGFNNPDGLYNEKNLDIVLIGDSFTQGACVEREENIAGELMASGKKVLNLGMQDSSPLNQLAILKEYGRPFRPKTVFWLFYEGNDHEGLAFEKNSPILMKYLKRDFLQNLINKQILIDQVLLRYVEKEYSLIEKNMNLINQEINELNKSKKQVSFNISLSSLKLPQFRNRLGIFFKDCNCEVDPLLKDIFIEAKRVIDEWEGQLYFVYLPAWERYPEKANYCRKRFLNTGKEKAISIIEELQIPVIDIQTVFDFHPDPVSLFPFKIKGHYNAKGYKLVAEHLIQYLSNDQNNVEKRF